MATANENMGGRNGTKMGRNGVETNLLHYGVYSVSQGREYDVSDPFSLGLVTSTQMT